jgi:phosphatidylethanolamine/phosphatidyl-N-methylethanolamine N-methyltransferase
MLELCSIVHHLLHGQALHLPRVYSVNCCVLLFCCPLIMPSASELSSPDHPIVKLYKRMARCYDMMFGALLNPGRRTLARALNLRGGQRVVELGIGSGLMLPLYPRDASVVGVDISPEMLELARSRGAALNMQHVQLMLADAAHTGLPAAQYDHVVLPYVYTVTPDPQALMREALRLCKPGGRIWILGYFSDLGPWRSLHWLVGPVAKLVGFAADFPYAQHVARHGWQVQRVLPANVFGMSRIVEILKPS